jgi:hypothetical protein
MQGQRDVASVVEDEIISNGSNGAFLRPRPRLHVLASELSKNLHSILLRLDGVRDEF